MYVFEDIAVAYATSALTGSYPTTRHGCTAVCFALLAMALGHLTYTLVVRVSATGDKTEVPLSANSSSVPLLQIPSPGGDHPNGVATDAVRNPLTPVRAASS